MNVTELARRLKVPTSELRELLPQLGFDVGYKAIKVDDRVAEKIINKVRSNPGAINALRRGKLAPAPEEAAETAAAPIVITVPATITVRDFAALLKKPVTLIIQELMKNGILANLNELIDYETASILAQDFGFTTAPQGSEPEADQHDTSIAELLGASQKDGLTRAPVVVVMGHVDHGKTNLLDAIRTTNVTAGEAGGITQHMGAYQVTKNNKPITFLDTPGHEAFTAMRSRGARVADIAILVIAADDGIKPQTEEVIKIIENAKLPFIVAINKIDKPEADIEKVKQQLAQKNLLPEDWGGKIICVPVSAKTGKGIDTLLENLLLLAEVEKKNISADPAARAIGTIIESHIDKGEGPVATAIIQTGTLHQGDTVQVGHVVGKIRTMKDYTNQIITAAPPSMPVKILGLKDVPEVGDFLQVMGDEISLKKMNKDLQHRQRVYHDKQLWQASRTKNNDQTAVKKSVNLMLKTDVLGSQEAITQSLETVSTDESEVKIIKKGLGNITETDVLQAADSHATIYGFNVRATTAVKSLADEKSVPLRLFTIIYDLIDDMRKEVDKLVSIKSQLIELGRVKVIAVFRTEKSSMIVGGLITKGKVEIGARARAWRDKEEIANGTLEKIQQGKQEVREVSAGTECGIQFKGEPILQVGDFLEVYREELTK